MMTRKQTTRWTMSSKGGRQSSEMISDAEAYSDPEAADQIEKMIRFSDPDERRELEAEQEAEQEAEHTIDLQEIEDEHSFTEPEWDGGYEKNSQPIRRPYQSPSGKGRVMLAGVGAALTAVLFGAVMMSWLSNGSQDYVPPAQSSLPSSEYSTPGEGDLATNDPLLEDADWAVPIRDDADYIVQYGVFSTAVGTEQALTDLANQGVPAVGVESGERTMIFIAAAASRNQADEWKKIWEMRLPELYIKRLPVTMPRIAADDRSYWTAADIWFSVLSDWSARTMSGEALNGRPWPLAVELQLETSQRLQSMVEQNSSSVAVMEQAFDALLQAGELLGGTHSESFEASRLLQVQQALIEYLVHKHRQNRML